MVMKLSFKSVIRDHTSHRNYVLAYHWLQTLPIKQYIVNVHVRVFFVFFSNFLTSDILLFYNHMAWFWHHELPSLLVVCYGHGVFQDVEVEYMKNIGIPVSSHNRLLSVVFHLTVSITTPCGASRFFTISVTMVEALCKKVVFQ